MAKVREHLDRAPIVEAIFDFRVKARPTFRSDALLSFGATPQLPKRDAHVSTPQLPIAPTAPLGDVVVLKSEDETSQAHFRIDGFTFNRLSPYTSWAELFPQALALWGYYASVAEPIGVTQIGLRYVNRIAIPSFESIRRHIETAPTIPPELPQALGTFFTRVHLHDLALDLTARVTQSLEMTKPEPTLILDIFVIKLDGFATTETPPMARAFEQLRRFKNLIFFSSLTEECVERFA